MRSDSKKKSRKGLVVLLAVVLLLGAGAGWYFLDGPGRERYTISFSPNGGEAVASITVKAGKSADLPKATKENYTLEGWYLGETKVSSPYKPTGNVTLTAIWQGNSVVIAFDPGNGENSILSNHICGSVLQFPPEPVYEKYHFIGWVDASGIPYEPGMIYEGPDLTLYGNWAENAFIVTFDSKGGSYVAPITLKEGETLHMPANPTKDGYRFVCWEDKYATPIYDGALLSCDDITLYAKWQKTSFTVSFDSRGGSKCASITVKEGDTLPALPVPTKDGYRFICWEDQHATPILEGALLSCSDITLYAKWIKKFTITFDSMGGSYVAPITLEDGDLLYMPANPTREGYHFVCWETASGRPIYDQALLSAEDIILYARWEKD